jgi:hypothetical protein
MIDSKEKAFQDVCKVARAAMPAEDKANQRRLERVLASKAEAEKAAS